MRDSEPGTVAIRTDATFSAFYRRELDGQVRRAALLLGSSEQANDVVHDAFTEIFRRWSDLDNPGPYLNRAVLNRCRDVARQHARRSRLASRLADEEQSWQQEPIADLLDALPWNQRAVIVLKFYVGMSNPEISDALGCPPGSVGPWIARALATIRKALP